MATNAETTKTMKSFGVIVGLVLAVTYSVISLTGSTQDEISASLHAAKVD